MPQVRISEDLAGKLQRIAENEKRSMTQQAILFLEKGVSESTPPPTKRSSRRDK